MPSYPSDWAKIEWSFLINDHRYYKLPLPERLAYLSLWVYAVATRRDWWMPKAFQETLDNVALHSRIPTSAVANMAVSALAIGLLSRKPGGAYFLDGVRVRHSKLRGWCTKWGAARDPAEERRRKESRREEPTQPADEDHQRPNPYGATPSGDLS